MTVNDFNNLKNGDVVLVNLGDKYVNGVVIETSVDTLFNVRRSVYVIFF